MSDDDYEEQLKAFKKDCRIACQYGIKCYQKNPTHHNKYKHPPKKQKEDSNIKQHVIAGKKRTNSECDNGSSSETNSLRVKLRKKDEVFTEVKEHSLSPSPSPETDKRDPQTEPEDSERSLNDGPSPIADSTISDKNTNTVEDISKTPLNKDDTNEENIDGDAADNDTSDAASRDPKKIISDLFLIDMPDDFYKFYDFCKSLSVKDPSNSLKLVDLKLVGPYDVLNGKITTNCQKDPEKFLRHWRYYYDPPEFQTILKGDDKEGLHYGYWRDTAEDKPIFVGKNSANNDCSIVPVAPNVFAAVNEHINDRAKKANPFEKAPILKLSKQLKVFARENGLSLDDENSEMRSRTRKVVAKTFHGAGIVVPYDKKTQLGYRDLAATDSQLKKILKKIVEAETDDERRKVMSQIEEVVRLATIAADESDFGTCLELGHDLFSSGVPRVHRIGLQMLSIAYNLLNRNKFLIIAEAHAKDRKKGCDLSVL